MIIVRKSIQTYLVFFLGNLRRSLVLFIASSDIFLDCFRKKNAVIHSYNKGFTGFAARLSTEEAKSISKRPGVVSVFPDPILQLHTTRSWDFLKYQTDEEIDVRPRLVSSNNGADTIIGILDTGEEEITNILLPYMLCFS